MMTGAALVERGHITEEEYTREFLDKANPVQRREQIERDKMRRALLPKILEDAMALGRVKLTNEIIAARGLDRWNEIGNLDVQALREARASTAPQEAGEGAAPQGDGTAGLGEGNGISPTVGANQARPQPGPRR